MKFSRIKLSGLFTILLGVNVLNSSPLHAESNVMTNVNGDEIIIYSDDSFKPAPRDLGSTDTSQSNAGKNNAGRKTGSPAISPAPVEVYGSEISPIYNSGEGVMPKTPRSSRLGETFDTKLSEPLLSSSLMRVWLSSSLKRL